MAWCPECRYEYVDGVKECPKCHVPLVASLSKAGESAKEQEAGFRYDGDTAISPTPSETVKEQKRPYAYPQVYQSKAQKAEDAKSSGISQVLVGGVVLVFVILWAFDLLPIRMGIVNRFMFCGVLGVFSLFWLILGVFSLRSFKRLSVFAQEEDRRTEEILKWGKSLETEAIDAPMEGLGLAEEEKYFGRMEIIHQLMSERFLNLDPDYAEDVSEKIYQQLYERIQ